MLWQRLSGLGLGSVWGAQLFTPVTGLVTGRGHLTDGF